MEAVEEPTALRQGGKGGGSGASGLTGTGGTSAGPGGMAPTSAGSGAGGGSGPSAGGAGGGPTLVGGNGGAGQIVATAGGDGGGGGGGYGFGGGGAGGLGGGGGGGGGGSDFVNPLILSPGIPVIHEDGVTHGDGRIVLTYQAAPIFCGATIYASMTLHQNLDCRGMPGITIGGLRNPGVDAGLNPIPVGFNLGGHTIVGDSGTTGIVVDRAAATIRNGTLTGFGTAIAASWLNGTTGEVAPNPTILNMTLTGGITGVADGAAAIVHSHVSNMSQAAVAVDGIPGSPRGTADVLASTITDSNNGIVLTYVPANITGNLITRNTGSGISGNVDAVGTITGNTVSHNGVGVSLGLCTCQLTVADNDVVRNHGVGIMWATGGGSDSQSARNVANHNGTAGDLSTSNDGIQVVGSAVTVVANQANNNIGYGIQASGATDGGANIATGNQGPAQCAGVVCSAV